MSLGASLTVVFIAFLTLMAAVMAMAFRERKASRAIVIGDGTSQGASDARVLTVLFVAMPGGMVLTVIVAWLVFL
jgi:hypothetical protein